MAELAEGKKAPAFSLKDKDGKKQALKDIEADYVVVYFYPKDDTPGCTVEALEFSRDLAKLRDAGAEVVGISGGDETSKQKFCAKHGLQVMLLSDPDFSVARKYGAYGEKRFMGRVSEGILRKTFVIGPDRRIAKIFPRVKPEGHAKEVLAVLSELA